MVVPHKISTIRLPQILQEEIAGLTSNEHARPYRHSRPHTSRKEARKDERAARKKRKAANRAAFFSTRTIPSKRQAKEDLSVSLRPGKVRPAEIVKGLDTSQRRQNVALQAKPTTLHAQPQELSRPVRDHVSRTRDEENEDAYISYLESKLGYSKGTKRRKTAGEDGLDDLLDFTSSIPGHWDPDGDPGRIGKGNPSGRGAGGVSDSEGSGEDENGEWHGLRDFAPSEEGSPSTRQEQPLEKAVTHSRYLPPHLRVAQHTSSDNSGVLVKLSKHLKGLLNRMSEQNLSTIISNVEDIYRNHRRHDVTLTLINIIVDGVVTHSSLSDSFVILHAAFVSALHKIIGIEFAANFVQVVVSLYEKHRSLLQDFVQEISSENDSVGKEAANLILLLSELYNFQVISSVLVYDTIREILNDDLTEIGIELLLKIVRNSGHQLRQDDPSALKGIIQIVLGKISGKDATLSPRMRFMIETLTNLKNNKSKKNVGQNQGAEAVYRMKKFLANLVKSRHGKDMIIEPKIIVEKEGNPVLAHEPLRISLDDLRSADTKGKWWLVGAAWAGDPLVDRQEKPDSITVDENRDSQSDLERLAREQGMNTEIRRNIFVVLMSSDDYVDACDRLSQLKLTETQQREIVRVILHCCGNEKMYNPYYTLVCQHLCRTSHSYKITLQFCLWDFLRDLGETSVCGAELMKTLKNDEGLKVTNISGSRIRNVAKAYAWWIAKDCVTLAILKPVDFTSLKTQTQTFLQEMLFYIFINSQRSTPTIILNPKDIPTTRDSRAIEDIFIKATRIKPFAMSLLYFISEAFRGPSEGDPEIEKVVRWASGLAKDTLRTGVDIVPDL